MSNQSKFESARDFFNKNKPLVGIAAGVLAVDAAIAAGAGIAYHDAAATNVLRVVAPEMEVSVDPLGLDRHIEDRGAVGYDTTSLATEIPSLDEAPQENPFLDGITS